MKTTLHATVMLGILAVSLSAAPATPGGLIDVKLTPADQELCAGTTLRVDLVLVSAGGGPQPFDATDAVLSWDPAVLQLIQADNSTAEASFFLAGFLPDPDGINADVTDGDAIYTALAQPGQTINAPSAPDGLIVTTFVFKALTTTASTEIELLPTMGVFGKTRVILVGAPVTGAIDGATATVNSPTCYGDLNCDGVVNVVDLLLVILDWGTDGSTNGGDVDGDGTVNVIDMIAVIIGWGVCP